MRLLRACCLLCALISSKDGKARGEVPPTAVGPPLHADEGDSFTQEPIQQQPVTEPEPGPAFSLKVQVNDALSRQPLSQAVVEVYVNYSRSDHAALTGQDGSVLLHVPYRSGLPITVVASRDGYMCTLLPCTTNRMPIFSSVTMSLHGLNQGNVWLYEDSVLITGITADVWSLPTVRFPQSLLNGTHSWNFTSIKALLTIPKLTSEQDGFVNTLGVTRSKSGYVSVQLSPVAAVSVHLYSEDSELDVSGPIQISLSIPDTSGLEPSHVVPAWFFNRTTGGWMRKGLGTVISVDGKLTWTFTAPHLGYWIAASASPARGSFGLAVPVDFILHHSFPLAALFGGSLVTVVCLLAGLIHYCRSTSSNSRAKRTLPVRRKDQTTSTCHEEVFEVSTGGAPCPQDGMNHSFTESRQNGGLMSMHSNNVIANPSAVAITLECHDLELSSLACSLQPSEQVRLPASPTDNLFFYNQPVAILHAPAFFHLDEQQELVQWSKSATLPRAGASTTDPPNKDGFTQALPKAPSDPQDQAVETEEQPGTSEGTQEATSSLAPRGPFNMPESASVPGTLNKLGHGRRSAHNLGGLGKILSPQPPRAWFVSLEGKPAAEIHYAVSEQQQRRRRPVESRETSLDSGVDMSELSQTSGRRTVTLERNATFTKSSSNSKHLPPQ